MRDEQHREEERREQEDRHASKALRGVSCVRPSLCEQEPALLAVERQTIRCGVGAVAGSERPTGSGWRGERMKLSAAYTQEGERGGKGGAL